jgi:hypothetical protein
MTGTVDFGDISPLNKIDGTMSYEEDGLTKIANMSDLARENVRLNLEEELARYESGRNRNGGYKEVAKIWSGTDEVLP